MSKKTLRAAMALAMANLAMRQDSILDEGYYVQQQNLPLRPIYKYQPKTEHYFTIRGKQILATSRKDAIKRYNHKYK